MTGKSIQNKSLVSIGLAIICLAVGYYTYSTLLPEYNSAKALKAQAESENQRLTKALDSIQQFLVDYERVSKNAQNIDLLLPTDNSDLANFINNLSSLAQASNVTLAGLQLSNDIPEKAPENSIQPVEIGFTSSGSYLAVKDFISKLQNNLRLMDIQSIVLNSPSQPGPGTSILEFQIKLKTYYQQ